MSIDREALDDMHTLIFDEEEGSFYIERDSDGAMSTEYFQTSDLAKQAHAAGMVEYF